MNYVLVLIESVCVSIYLNMHFNFDLISSKNMFNIKFYAFAHFISISEMVDDYNLFLLIFVGAENLHVEWIYMRTKRELERCFPLKYKIKSMNQQCEGKSMQSLCDIIDTKTEELKWNWIKNETKSFLRQCNEMKRYSAGNNSLKQRFMSHTRIVKRN